MPLLDEIISDLITAAAVVWVVAVVAGLAFDVACGLCDLFRSKDA